MPIKSIAFVLFFTLALSITAPAQVEDTKTDLESAIAQQHVNNNIALITSLFERSPVSREISPQAQKVRNEYIEELAYMLSQAQPDAQREDLNRFARQLINWSKRLPDFSHELPAGYVHMDAQTPEAISEKERENYLRNLAKALAFNMNRIYGASGVEKNILQQISIRIIAEAFLVASLTEPDPQDVALANAKSLLGPLFLTFAYPIVSVIVGHEFDPLITGGLAMGATIVFLQNIRAHNTPNMKPWLVSDYAKKRVHIKRADHLLRIFFDDFFDEIIGNEIDTKKFLETNFNFERIRKSVLKEILSADVKMNNLTAEDCKRALRD